MSLNIGMILSFVRVIHSLHRDGLMYAHLTCLCEVCVSLKQTLSRTAQWNLEINALKIQLVECLHRCVLFALDLMQSILVPSPRCRSAPTHRSFSQSASEKLRLRRTRGFLGVPVIWTSPPARLSPTGLANLVGALFYEYQCISFP